jgi:large-conductance mechanosensitive channel
MDFQDFIKDQQIASVGISFLIAQATLDTSKSFVGSLVMPLITAIKTMKAPQFPVANFLASIITFFITMFIAFVVVKLLRLQVKQVPLVQVVNSDVKTV